MKHLKQFCRILAISFIGEILHLIIPAPIPASVYGMIVLFLALRWRIVKLEEIESTGELLLAIMPLALIPAAVGLVETWTEITRLIVPGVILILFGTLLTTLASGAAAQGTIRLQGKNKK